jgi:hypothetical protein
MEIPFQGVPFYMNGQKYYIPSLSLKQFRDNQAILTETAGEVTSDNLQEQFSKYIPLIRLAVNRNYPDITEDDLWEWLDLGTFREIFLIVQSASGMKPVSPGE